MLTFCYRIFEFFGSLSRLGLSQKGNVQILKQSHSTQCVVLHLAKKRNFCVIFLKNRQIWFHLSFCWSKLVLKNDLFLTKTAREDGKELLILCSFQNLKLKLQNTSWSQTNFMKMWIIKALASIMLCSRESLFLGGSLFETEEDCSTKSNNSPLLNDNW